jgi:probable HAF family extracellular repeat protein
MSRIRLGMWAVMALILLPLAGAQSYTITGMGTLGGSESDALSVNDHGEAAGYSYLSTSDGFHAFVWTASTGMLDLGNFDGSSASSEAKGINNIGQVCGYSFFADGETVHPFLWTKATGLRDLGTLGGTYGVGNAINSSGEVVGNSYLADGVSLHAFLWTSATGMQDLGTLGGPTSSAEGINDSGQVVGFASLDNNGTVHAFLWTQATGMQDLGTLGGETSAAYGINAAGEIAGSASNSVDATVAVLWAKDLGIRSLNAGSQSVAIAVSSSDQAVGVYGKGPFLWTPAKRLLNLNTLIPPHTGWFFVNANGINRTGQIAATGQIGSKTEAALLTPDK